MKNCGVGGGELVHLSYGVSGLLTGITYGICHENMGCCESFFLNITNMEIDSLQT